MDINLKQAADFMLANDYILAVGKGKFKLSTKFHRDYAQLSKNYPQEFTGQGGPVFDLVKIDAQLAALAKYDWEGAYKKFIIEALVPRRLESTRGETYPGNTYSEAGMKAFRKAMEANYDPFLMAKAVTLYYKSSTKFKMAIGRLMEEGHWKTFYDELKEAAGKGVEAVNNLVTEQTQSTDVDHYQLG